MLCFREIRSDLSVLWIGLALLEGGMEVGLVILNSRGIMAPILMTL